VAEPLRLDGAGVVVTGAASGIGAALARRFAAEGARLVLGDLDEAGLGPVADATGALAVPGDAADPAGLVVAAREHLGAVDLFCANAGVAPVGGAAADPAAWQQAWEVNVLAHVRAAQALLPHWLERGRGHLLATVSAAGLLTMLGSAPYAVSKHAALAFAEWLRATYDHRGITVQALCPMGVRTPLLEGTGELGRALLDPDAIEADDVAASVVDALGDGRFLVLPHAEVAGHYAARAADPDRWLAGMNRLQQRLDLTLAAPPGRTPGVSGSA
jgi:NAD(P)-dependent dehydrogenase (short-subunit alcohol dehydrogenase family)